MCLPAVSVVSDIETVRNHHSKEAAKSPGWLKEMRGAEMIPETIEYGISSFVYRSRKPFVPQKIYDLMVGNFLLQERADGEEETENEESEEEIEETENEEENGDAFKKRLAARAAGPFAQVKIKSC